MAQDRLNCIHHWMIKAQSVGTCIKCGDRRDFADIQAQKQREVAATRAVSVIRRNEAKHNS